MAWSFGHSLIVILAVALGLAAGWLLRGLRAARTAGPSSVDEPAPGTTMLAAPAPATDVDPADVALTDGPEPAPVVAPRAVPAAERTAPAGDTDQPVAAEEPVAAPAPRPVAATPPVRSVAAASVEVDDFRRIQGVGPKMAAALQAAGVRTYRQLAELDEAGLREVIRGAGLRAAPGLATWPQQAKVLAGTSDQVTSALPAGNTDPA